MLPLLVEVRHKSHNVDVLSHVTTLNSFCTIWMNFYKRERHNFLNPCLVVYTLIWLTPFPQWHVHGKCILNLLSDLHCWPVTGANNLLSPSLQHREEWKVHHDLIQHPLDKCQKQYGGLSNQLKKHWWWTTHVMIPLCRALRIRRIFWT